MNRFMPVLRNWLGLTEGNSFLKEWAVIKQVQPMCLVPSSSSCFPFCLFAMLWYSQEDTYQGTRGMLFGTPGHQSPEWNELLYL